MATVSVVLASFNGEKYIAEQVSSILKNLMPQDELIISDDGSTDRTLEILRGFNDSGIILLDGPRKGFVKNFENAICRSKNDIIFLSDQDDVWDAEKRNIVVSIFNDKINVVKHDAIIVDENLFTIISSYNKKRKANVGYLRNIIANTFTGCCMAFKRDWLLKMLPVPDNIYHDWWFGVLACKFKCVKIISNKLILYRRHTANVSQMKPQSLLYRIRQRAYLLKQLRQKYRELKEKKKYEDKNISNSFAGFSSDTRE